MAHSIDKMTSLDGLDERSLGKVILIDMPEDQEPEMFAHSLKELTRKSFQGIYISFQSPPAQVQGMMGREDLAKVVFVDAASGGEGVDRIVREICVSLTKMSSRKKFIFLASVSDFSKRVPLSETMRLFGFLDRMIRKSHSSDLVLVLTSSHGSMGKDLRQGIAITPDKIVSGSFS